MHSATKYREEPEPRWPWASILLLGTFGRRDEASRRYQQRSGIALLLALAGFAVWAVLATWLRQDWVSYLPTIFFVATFTYISFQTWVYISALDELSRTLQLEALAITYLIGFPVFLTAYFLTAGTGWSWRFACLAYVGLELVRGAVLAMRARRYR